MREISGILLSFWIELIFNYENCSAPSRCKEIHPSEHQKCNCRVLQILNPTPLSVILPLSSTTGTTIQFVPPSAAVSPGGLSLPQLAAEWNNHAVTPQEQKGPTPSARKPTLPFGGVFVTQRVIAPNAFS